MWERFTERARAAVYYAQEECARHRVGWIGPEALVVGLLHDTESVASAALRSMQVEPAEVQQAMRQLLAQHGTPEPVSGTPRLTASAKRAMGRAREEAAALGCDYIGTEHLLLGLILEGSEASDVLSRLGVSAERLRAAIGAVSDGTAHGGVTLPTSEDTAALIASDALGLRGMSVLSIGDLTPEQVEGVLRCAEAFRHARVRGERLVDWKGRKSLALLFEKASLRTRVTFELGMAELGGIPVVLGPSEVGLGKRESVADVAANLDRWVSAVAARVFDHETLVVMHKHSSIPIVNALSDREHPCQALADLQTVLQHKGRLNGLRLAWVGDGNNVLHSLMLAALGAGMSVTAACPPGYEPAGDMIALARDRAAQGATVEIVRDPMEAVEGADVVYTDVWTSMGHESEAEERRLAFAAYQVNEALMKRAGSQAIFMHCLPAHRGEEVTDGVLDGPQSVVLDQAENRLHAQKALLALLLGP